MKTELCAAVVLAAGLGSGVTWDQGRSADAPRAAAPQAPAAVPTANAFLFGESIPKNAQPVIGIDAARIQWWLGGPDGKKIRRLDDPKTVRPVDRTVILKRDNDGLTLLGPDGGDVYLSLKDGPLAKAEIQGPGQVTTFSFTLDRKAVVFANAKGAICRIPLGSKDLTVFAIGGVNQGDGIRFSPDGTRIAYSKCHRADNVSPVVFSVYVASADGTSEKKLTEFTDGKDLGFGFLSDGRVGVVGPTSIRAIDPKTGKSQPVAGPWKDRLSFRAFGGFNPDGSTFIYDLGGPYVLNLYAFDVKTKKVTTVKEQYLESFQQMVWVRVPAAKP